MVGVAICKAIAETSTSSLWDSVAIDHATLLRWRPVQRGMSREVVPQMLCSSGLSLHDSLAKAHNVFAAACGPNSASDRYIGSVSFFKPTCREASLLRIIVLAKR